MSMISPGSDAPGSVEMLDGVHLADISTTLVQLHRRFYGRGPTRARTIAAHDIVTCVLEDILTTVERTLVEKGRADLVVEVRNCFQGTMGPEFVAAIERLTGRSVVSFTSGVDVEHEVATETFVLAPLA